MPSTERHDAHHADRGGFLFALVGSLAALSWLAAVVAGALVLNPLSELDPWVRAAIGAAAASPAVALFAAGVAAQGAANAARAARRMHQAADRLLHPETVQALDAATLERWAKRQISQLNESLSSTVEHLSALDAAFRTASERLKTSAEDAGEAFSAVTADLQGTAMRFEHGVSHVQEALSGAKDAMTKGAESALEAAQLADERLTRTTDALETRTDALNDAGAQAARQVEALDEALRRAVEKFEAVSETALTTSEGLATRFDSRAEELLDAADQIDSRRREFDDALWRGAETLSQTAERVAERAQVVGDAIDKGAATLHMAGESQLTSARGLAGELNDVIKEIESAGKRSFEDLIGFRDTARDALERAMGALSQAQAGFSEARKGANGLIESLETAGERQARLLEDVVARRLAKAISLANQAIDRSETLEREALRRLRRSHERGRAAMRLAGRSSVGGQSGASLRDVSAPDVDREAYPGVACLWTPPAHGVKAKRGAISNVASRLSSIFTGQPQDADASEDAPAIWSWEQVFAVAGADQDDLPSDPAARRALAASAADEVRRRLSEALGEDAVRAGLEHADPRTASAPAAAARHGALVGETRRLFLGDDAFGDSARRFIAAFEHDAPAEADPDDPLGLTRLLDQENGRLYLIIGQAVGHLDDGEGAVSQSPATKKSGASAS